MRKRINNILLILVCLIPLSCDFEFADDSFLDINIEDPEAVISMSNFTDKQIFNEPTLISYSYSSKHINNLLQLRIQINDETVVSGADSIGTFLIDTDAWDEGDYTLKVDYVYSSGTGSLADINNVEAYKSSYTYGFSIVKSPPATIDLDKVEVINGSIFLSWNPIDTLNIEEAVLRIDHDGLTQKEVKLSNEDLVSQSYQDKNGVENNLTYTITTKSKYKKAVSNTIELIIEPISIKREYVNSNQYKLIWTEHPLYANFDFFKCDISTITQIKLNNRGGELLVNEIPLFGDVTTFSRIEFNLCRITKAYPHGKNLSYFSRNIPIGQPFQIRGKVEFAYNSTTGDFLCVKLVGDKSYKRKIYLYRLRQEDMSIIDTTYIDTQKSDDINIIFDSEKNQYIIDLDMHSYLIDASTLSTIKQFKARDYNQTETNIRTYYRKGYVVIVNYVNKVVTIFDAITKNEVYHVTRKKYFKISPTGDYFCVDDNIYELKDGAVHLELTFDDKRSVPRIEFMPNLNKCVFWDPSGKYYRYDFDTKEKRQINDLRGWSFQYDSKTKKMITRELRGLKSNIYILDVEALSFKKVWVNSDSKGRIYRFLNGRLIFSGGYYLDKFVND